MVKVEIKLTEYADNGVSEIPPKIQSCQKLK